MNDQPRLTDRHERRTESAAPRAANPLRQLRSRLGLPDPLPVGPMDLLDAWLREALNVKAAPDPNAMVLATATPDGRPSARVVLCKALEPDPPAIVFYTNHTSRKAMELERNPRAACVFHWGSLGRQARAEGPVSRVRPEESDEYFRSRPLLSRLGAWASEQGRPLARRTDLIRRVRQAMRRFGVRTHHLIAPGTAPDIPRPEHWGGYRLGIEIVELWLGGGGRLHDRAIWTRSPRGAWSSTRVQP